MASKRGLDVGIATLLLLVLAPVYLLIALAVRRDGGPALYRSRRIGQGGKEFFALKFRTMVPDAEAALRELFERDAAAREEYFRRFKLENDPRITPIGRPLRKSSLDELPQLLNVLRGEMSLVGPRPLLPSERDFHSPADFALYCQMTPGLTGLWQISGRDNLEYTRRIELNNWYVNNWSIFLDLSILVKTALILPTRADAS